jgi:hypothetical protein
MKKQTIVATSFLVAVLAIAIGFTSPSSFANSTNQVVGTGPAKAVAAKPVPAKKPLPLNPVPAEPLPLKPIPAKPVVPAEPVPQPDEGVFRG